MKPLAITLGDPSGIGAEVVSKALRKLKRPPPFLIFGSRDYARESPGARVLEELKRVHPQDLDSDSNHLFVDVGRDSDPSLRWGSVDKLYGRVALDSIHAALAAIENGICGAMVTAPIHKESISLAGSEHAGHTEILAARAGLERYAHDYAMYFASPVLRVALLSVHLSLREALDRIDAETVDALCRLVDREYPRLEGPRPRIGVAALNPHGGESGKFGREEEKIADGVERASKSGVNVRGPFSADTIFLNAMRGDFDVVVALYHDQGLIPIKTIEFDRSVNVTLGLPYLRVSVDHGTAFDIAGQDKANPEPMRHAIEWAARHAVNYRR